MLGRRRFETKFRGPGGFLLVGEVSPASFILSLACYVIGIRAANQYSAASMNPTAIVYGIVAVIIVNLALPLIGRRVKMNSWYGVRIPESFRSESRWYEINEYGGRLLIYWAALIALVASSGLFVRKEHWESYAWTSTVIILGGLGLVVAAIYRYAAKTKK